MSEDTVIENKEVCMSEINKLKEASEIIMREVKLRELLSYFRHDLDISIAMAILDPYDQFFEFRESWLDSLEQLYEGKVITSAMDVFSVDFEKKVAELNEKYSRIGDALIQSVNLAIANTSRTKSPQRQLDTMPSVLLELNDRSRYDDIPYNDRIQTK